MRHLWLSLSVVAADVRYVFASGAHQQPCSVDVNGTCDADGHGDSEGVALLQDYRGRAGRRKQGLECTELDGDPWATGRLVECCGGLYQCLRPGIWAYRCTASCEGCSSCTPSPLPPPQPTPPPTPSPPPAPTVAPPTPSPTETACTELDGDPWSTGQNVPCCGGLYQCLKPGIWAYRCTSSCDGCSSCTPSPLPPPQPTPSPSPQQPTPSPTPQPTPSPTLQPTPSPTNPTPAPPTPAPTQTPCTELDGDPWATGQNVPCCGGLYQCLKPGIWAYRCTSSCDGCSSCTPSPLPPQPTPSPTPLPPQPTPSPSPPPTLQPTPSPTKVPPPPPTPTPTLSPPTPTSAPTQTSCTALDDDPYGTGTYQPCCGGLYKCLKSGIWQYRCTSSCDGCYSCDPSPLPPEPTAAPTPAPPTPAPPPTPPTPPPASKGIKFLLWNVYYRNQNINAMADIINPNNASIVGLCEFTADPFQLAQALSIDGRDFKVQPGVTGGYSGYGTDIWYDANVWEAIEGGKERVECPGTRGGARGANWVVLQSRATEQMIITGGTHLSYCAGNTCDWTQECELGRLYDRFYEMKDRYADAQVAWMGDLNHAITDLVVRNLLGGRIGPRSVFPVADLAQTEGNTYYSGGSAIDHILGQPDFVRISGGLTGQGTRGQWLAGSDHFPVYSLTVLYKVPPVPPVGYPECAQENEDPFARGLEVKCCRPLKLCLQMSNWHYDCRENCLGCASCTENWHEGEEERINSAAVVLEDEEVDTRENATAELDEQAVTA
eukprot:TRINITY_DN1705_c0_g1_i3.p1 TRINITY_DN1705_c0_g1~~TRINITY_DN1705_c0_g1_i3.p1  ORF type:complete len:772 (-),score=55.02 TRINITY_DN1705_c0_g1_i3:101-2416(-)